MQPDKELVRQKQIVEIHAEGLDLSVDGWVTSGSGIDGWKSGNQLNFRPVFGTDFKATNVTSTMTIQDSFDGDILLSVDVDPETHQASNPVNEHRTYEGSTSAVFTSTNSLVSPGAGATPPRYKLAPISPLVQPAITDPKNLAWNIGDAPAGSSASFNAVVGFPNAQQQDEKGKSVIVEFHVKGTLQPDTCPPPPTEPSDEPTETSTTEPSDGPGGNPTDTPAPGGHNPGGHNPGGNNPGGGSPGDDTPGSDPSLPRTGTEIAGAAAIGAVSVGAGTVALVASRRRRR